MAYWEHPDTYLDAFKETHPNFAPEVEQFVSTFQFLIRHGHQKPQPAVHFNMKYINALIQHATRPAGLHSLTTDDFIARWVRIQPSSLLCLFSFIIFCIKKYLFHRFVDH